jgi:MraZ protein
MQRRMLHGTYECTFDNRFRLAIPAKVRDAFVEGAAVSMWFDDCAIVAPRLDWPDIVREVFGVMDVQNPRQRRLSRYLHAYTQEIDSLDRQGRIIVPENVRARAGLDGKVKVVGAGDYLEIWNPARLEEALEVARREGVSSDGNPFDERAE